jgi:murein DD-endopeptidase MepM/ murein hydrolase activator NlpD
MGWGWGGLVPANQNTGDSLQQMWQWIQQQADSAAAHALGQSTARPGSSSGPGYSGPQVNPVDTGQGIGPGDTTPQQRQDPGYGVPADPSQSSNGGAVQPSQGQVPAASAPPTNMPFPFDKQYFSDVTQSFGQASAEGGVEDGIDYGMPVGTQIVSPVSGKVVVEDMGKNDWGKRVFVQTASGWTFAVGHMTSFSADVLKAQSAGGTIQAGTVLGASGGDPSDPSSGMSTGAHIEVQWMDPQGNFTDPSAMMQALNQGVTTDQFVSLGLDAPHGGTQPGVGPRSATPGTFATSGTTAASQPYYTPDHHLITPLSPEDNQYQTADRLWQQMYGSGTHAPWSVVAALAKSGATDQQSIQALMAQWPSHIPNLTMGQYTGMMNTAQKLSDKYWGRPIPDSLISEWASQGITSPEAINLWFLNHPATSLPKDEFQAVYDQAAQFTNQTWGTAPHPDQVVAIHNAITGNPQIQQPVIGTPPAQTTPGSQIGTQAPYRPISGSRTYVPSPGG